MPSDAKSTVFDMANHEADESMLSPSQAARELDVSAKRAVQLADAGKLRCIKTPLGRLFDRADVERLARERRARP
jgi:hypothetical protein